MHRNVLHKKMRYNHESSCLLAFFPSFLPSCSFLKSMVHEEQQQLHGNNKHSGGFIGRHYSFRSDFVVGSSEEARSEEAGQRSSSQASVEASKSLFSSFLASEPLFSSFLLSCHFDCPVKTILEHNFFLIRGFFSQSTRG